MSYSTVLVLFALYLIGMIAIGLENFLGAPDRGRSVMALSLAHLLRQFLNEMCWHPGDLLGPPGCLGYPIFVAQYVVSEPLKTDGVCIEKFLIL